MGRSTTNVGIHNPEGVVGSSRTPATNISMYFNLRFSSLQTSCTQNRNLHSLTLLIESDTQRFDHGFRGGIAGKVLLPGDQIAVA